MARPLVGRVPLRRALLSKWREELGERQPKCRRQLRCGADTDVALATFDAADVIAVQAGSCRQFLLRHFPVSSQFPHAPSDGDGQSNGHAAYRGELNTTGLHTIVFIYSECNWNRDTTSDELLWRSAELRLESGPVRLRSRGRTRVRDRSWLGRLQFGPTASLNLFTASAARSSASTRIRRPPPWRRSGVGSSRSWVKSVSNPKTRNHREGSRKVKPNASPA